jgi:hypothetical protein
MASTAASAAGLAIPDLVAALAAVRRGRMILAIEWAFPIRTKRWQADSIPTGLMAAALMAADLAAAPALVSADSAATGRQPTVTPARTDRHRRIMARALHPRATGLHLRVTAATTPRRFTAVRLRLIVPFRPRIRLLRVARITLRRDPIRPPARTSRLHDRSRLRALPVAPRTSPVDIQGSPAAIQVLAVAVLPAAGTQAEAAVTIARSRYHPQLALST